jgi:hypothetical protein
MICHRAEVQRGIEWTGRNHFIRDAFDFQAYLPPPSMEGFPNAERNLAPGRLDTDWKVNVYDDAIIKADYRQVDYEVLPDSFVDAYAPDKGSELVRFVSYRRERTAKYLGLPGGQLYYVLPPLPGEIPLTDSAKKSAYDKRRLIAFSVGFVEGQQTIYAKQWGIAIDAFPYHTCDALIGKVNRGTFLGYPEGTLLYMPYKEDTFPMGERIGINAEHVFLHVPMGHNKLLRSVKEEPRTYYYVTSDSTLTEIPIGELPESLRVGKFLYDYENFQKAFNPKNP